MRHTILLILALACAASSQAQSIVGNISTTFGVPIPGVLVTASRTGQTVSDTTDASGNYSIATGIHPTSTAYSVVPGKSGYTFTPASTNVTLLSFAGNVTVNFTAPATVPLAITEGVNNLTTTSAVLVGQVNPQGAATVVHFDYGLTTSYGSVSSFSSAGNGTAYVGVNIQALALSNGANYHFRVVASNACGITLGDDVSFSTLSGLPTVSTLNPIASNSISMKLNGSANPNGATATALFEWGPTTNYGNLTPGQNLGAGVDDVLFSQVLTGLTTLATYHYRAVAMTSFATNFGADTLFTPLLTDFSSDLPAVLNGSAAWGDYDYDGRLDILLTGLGTNGVPISQVWRNTGTGFGNINAGLPGVQRSSAAWGDYDNDGRLDILLAGTTNGVESGAIAQVWRNTGSGFTNINAGLPGVIFGSVAWGDYDNDGRLDILLMGLGANSLPITQVWRNTGTGFVNINAGLPGVCQGSVAWGDYDNDGRLDILLTGRDSIGNVYSQVWRNTGSGFVNMNAGLPGVYIGSATWGDYDDDGWLDILLTGETTAGPITQIWRNTGTAFTNINAGLVAVEASSAAWGDYDNDGRLDILLTGTSDGQISGLLAQVWRNTGSGFTNMYLGLPGIDYGSVAWGDFDNDGRLDILQIGDPWIGSSYLTRVWRNNYPVTNQIPAAPTALAASAVGTTVTLTWNPATDNQTLSSGLTYNVRAGSAPGASDVIGPMAGDDGHRRLPQIGNAQERLSLSLPIQLGQTYYWSVQAVDSAFAGSPFATEQQFTVNTVLTPPNGIPVPGDLNGDGIVSQSELDLVLSNYWPYSPWLYLTNVAGLGGTNVTFALTNSTAGAFSVEYSTNLMDWYYLGPATPRYLFTDTNAPAVPERSYRLRWP